MRRGLRRWGALLAAVCGVGGPAGAAEITLAAAAEAGCFGAARCRVGAAVLEAGPAPDARFDAQSFRGVHGLGVGLTFTRADRDHELQGPIAAGDVPGESIAVAFDTPHSVRRVVLAHLYNPGVAGDPREEAVISAYRGGRRIGLLRLMSVTDRPRDFVLTGRAERVARTSASGGAYVIAGPFMGVAVDRLVFSAGAVERGDTSDYSIVAVEAVPAE